VSLVTPPPPPDTEPPVYFPHPRVIERTADGVVTVTILLPRNPLRLGHLSPLIFASAMSLVLAGFILRGTRNISGFVLAMFACMLAWLVAELPDLIRGLHTRVELLVTPTELGTIVRYAWAERTTTYRRDQVLGVRLIRNRWHSRSLHLRFKDCEPLEIMAGYPDDHLNAAAGAIRHAFQSVAASTAVLHADDPATLPYAGAGPSYEVEVIRLADGSVSVSVPPPPRNHVRALGGLLFAAMWLLMFASIFNATWRQIWWCPIVPLFLLGGTWAMAVAIRTYLYRNEPMVLAMTPSELVIENGPWFRRTRRIPRSGIRSIAIGGSGKERTYVLRITAKREIDLMADRETDEIERVAEALNDAK
jgi:hypothetical protein